MDKDSVLTIIERFIQVLKRKGISVDKAILYGSYAHKTQHEGSDIDLVVVSASFVGKDYWERLKILSDAIYEVWEPIEAVAMTPEEWARGDGLIAQFARDGELAYGS